MSTIIKFLILYLLPVLSFAGVIGIYLLAYGKSLDNPLIEFAFFLSVFSFIASSYLSVKLISCFVTKSVNYWGILFSCLGFVLGIIPILVYLLMFKDIFRV